MALTDDGVNVETTQTVRNPVRRAAQPVLDRRQAGPTVPRMALGVQLRTLREARGLSRDQAGAAISVSRSKISRLELGRTGCKPHDVEALLDLYGVRDDGDRQAVRALAEQANMPGWWQAYCEVIPAWLQDYLGLEQAARVIRSFEVQFVPGLLQTPDYARAVIRLGHRGSPEAELERRVELRLRRQEVLHRDRPPHLWVVMDEAVLHRPVGSSAVLRDQLDHLVMMSRLPQVTVQVLPFASGGHAALAGPITMLRLPGGQLPDMVFLEQLTNGIYPDKQAEVHHYWDVLNRLVVDAEPAAASRELMRRSRDRL